MTAEVTIIVRYREEDAGDLEALFEAQVVPLWKEFQSAGKFFRASLSRVLDGSEMKEGFRDYVVHVELPGEKEHDEFDTHPRFLSFMEKNDPMLVGEPLVWIGEPVARV